MFGLFPHCQHSGPSLLTFSRSGSELNRVPIGRKNKQTKLSNSLQIKFIWNKLYNHYSFKSTIGKGRSAAFIGEPRCACGNKSLVEITTKSPEMLNAYVSWQCVCSLLLPSAHAGEKKNTTMYTVSEETWRVLALDSRGKTFGGSDILPCSRWFLCLFFFHHFNGKV